MAKMKKKGKKNKSRKSILKKIRLVESNRILIKKYQKELVN